jgi:hypothetical protein
MKNSQCWRLLLLLASVALGACAESTRGTGDVDLSGGGGGDDLSTPFVPPDLTPVYDLSASVDLVTCGNCDDNIGCTVDTCLMSGECEHTLDHSRCADTEVCTPSGCVPGRTTKLCSPCDNDSDCSLGEVCGSSPVDGGTGTLCLATCTNGTLCAKGFTCDPNQSPPRCVPDQICCFDPDGDKHGYGWGCFGGDCDEHDSTIYEGAPEVCDTKDNNCNGTVDEGFLCTPPQCVEVNSSGTFAGTPPGRCTSGSCSDETPVSCGRYTCQLVTQPQAGSTCRTSCTGTDDSACIDNSYCDGASCVDRQPDSSPCTRNRMCASNHCQNGFCCAGGDCCKIPADCPSSYAGSPACDAPLGNCQGHRIGKTCALSICGSAPEDDDSACDASITLDCSSFSTPNQHCTASSSQVPLACPTNCPNDSGCVGQTWCSGAPSGTCVAKLPNGASCGGNNQCLSGHCQNNHCCATGDCCAVAGDCPASYTAAPVCDGPTYTNCQGHRMDKACNANICGSVSVADDRACTSSISVGCGTYQPVYCNASATQNPLACPTSCIWDFQCTTPANHCFGSHCVPWVEQGGGCFSNAQCRTGNCVNGICCNTSCNNTACDSCATGSCNYYSDYYETGSWCGDGRRLGSGQFDVSISATIENASDSEDWFWIYATDGNNACFWPINDYGHLIVTLTIPSWVDYDLYLYKWTGDCNNLQLIGSSTNGTGATDRVDFQEDCGGDDTAWYLIKVVRYSSYSCSTPYGLAISAHL